MKKILLTLICVFFLIACYANNQQDSLYVSSKEYQILNAKIIQLEKDKTELNQKIIGVQNENDKRSSVLTWSIGLIVVLSLGAAIYNIVVHKHIVRKQVNEEIKEYEEKFEELESKGVQMVKSLENQIDVTQKTEV